MEIIGGFILAIVVLANAFDFFGASSHQKRLYEKTVSDTEFNKSAHQKI